VGRGGKEEVREKERGRKKYKKNGEKREGGI